MDIKERLQKVALKKQKELKKQKTSKKRNKINKKQNNNTVSQNKKETKSTITGNLIKDAMKAKKLTQSKLAKMVGTTPYMISQFQNGKQVPKSKFIPKLEEILEIKLSGDVADIKAAAGDVADIENEWENKIIKSNTLLEHLGVDVIWLNKSKGEYYYSTDIKNPFDNSNVERKALERFNKQRRKKYKNWSEATESEIPLSKKIIRDYGQYLNWNIILTKQDLTNETDEFIWNWRNVFRMLIIGIIVPEYDFDIEYFKLRWDEVRMRKDPKVIKRRKAFRKGQRKKALENMAQSK